jgi:hypothetical protein
MNKYAFMSVPVLVGILFVSGCGNAPVAPYSFQNQKGMEQIPSTTSPLATSTCLTGCNALESGSGLVSKENCKAGCWTEEAKQKKDITLCATKIPKENSLMLLGCQMAVAEAVGDVKLCDTIGDSMNDLMRGACYATIAKQKKDASLCEPLKGMLMYEGCVSDVKGESSTPTE